MFWGVCMAVAAVGYGAKSNPPQDHVIWPKKELSRGDSAEVKSYLRSSAGLKGQMYTSKMSGESVPAFRVAKLDEEDISKIRRILGVSERSKPGDVSLIACSMKDKIQDIDVDDIAADFDGSHCSKQLEEVRLIRRAARLSEGAPCSVTAP